MKKAALIAAALAMTLSLAACGNRDNNTHDNQTSGTTENGTTNNGTTTNGTNNGGTTNGTTNGTTGSNDSIGGSTGTGTGTDAGLGSTGTGSNAGTGTGTGVGSSTGTGSARSSVGNDLRRAADDVGDAVTGLMDDGRSAVARNTNTTSFQRMLNNARVHDVDGVLTDGENSRW